MDRYASRPNRLKWLFLAGILLLVIFLVEGAFVIVQLQMSKNIGRLIELQFNPEKSFVSLQELSQALMDIERARLVDCLVVKDAVRGTLFFQINEVICEGTKFSRTLLISAVNGSGWSVQYRPHVDSTTIWLFWLLRISSLLIAILLWSLFQYRNRLILAEAEKTNALRQWSRRVGHDLRSPLSALNIALSSEFVLLGRADRLVKNSVRQISDIASTLLSSDDSTRGVLSKKNLQDEISFKEIEREISALIQQKNVELQNIKILLSCVESHTDVIYPIGRSDIARNLSNVINNSAEAMSHRETSVFIDLRQSPEGALNITISDEGPGFTSEVLEAHGLSPFTFGKDNGYGLGLSGLKTWLTNLSGKLILSNRPGGGASVHISIPSRY